MNGGQGVGAKGIRITVMPSREGLKACPPPGNCILRTLLGHSVVFKLHKLCGTK